MKNFNYHIKQTFRFKKNKANRIAPMAYIFFLSRKFIDNSEVIPGSPAEIAQYKKSDRILVLIIR